MKGYNMIARIIMSEHPNEKDLEHFTSDHKDAVKDGFLANTQFSILCKQAPLHCWLFQDMKINPLQTPTFKHVKSGLMKEEENT